MHVVSEHEAREGILLMIHNINNLLLAASKDDDPRKVQIKVRKIEKHPDDSDNDVDESIFDMADEESKPPVPGEMKILGWWNLVTVNWSAQKVA